ncbi:MAG: hypothetical protein ACI9SY_000605 [Candidatus Paceibacteria bacterium]|jgi:hypothetical protein
MSGFNPEKITFFAKTDTRGAQVPFGIKAKDRQRHMYVIGKTGMGKSTLLENMAAQDIQNGEGMAFIDPHGSAIETLLDYIPEDRLDDVVYFAPFDMENPVAFNIMEDVGMDTRHLVVSGLMSTFKKIWEDAWSARMEYILTNALLALIEYPDTTLLSVNRMLADKTYRDKVIANVKDPAVKAYWIDEFNNYTERFAAEALPAIQNKIGQFTGNPLIRNIIGQPKSSFDVRKMMDEKKILLINLSKGLVGETNADLIGSMLITKIYLAAMSRAELSPVEMKQMPNFYFYVDEFQSFANSTFANILSEARKYHLNLIIAHQYVAQMEEKIRDAVFGNVGTTIAFRTGPFDAEVLETVFAPQFEAADLVNLGFAQVCLTLMIDGVGSPPFSAVTLPPVQTPQVSHKMMAIKRSQKNYSRPRSEVEQLVVDSHAPVERLEAAAENGHGNKGGFTKPSAFFKVGKDKAFVKQKEQLKDGGSIKRGPAQTPPGTGAKSPEQKNTQPRTEQKPQATSPDKKDQSRKPAHSGKTPEDLRAILAGMTAGTSSVKETGKSKDSAIPIAQKSETKEQAFDAVAKETQSVEKKVSNPDKIADQKNDQRQQSSPRVVGKTKDYPDKRKSSEFQAGRSEFKQKLQNETKKSDENRVSVETKKDDLKSALAALVVESTVDKQSESSQQKVELKSEIKTDETQQQNNIFHQSESQANMVRGERKLSTDNQLQTQSRPQPQLSQSPVEQPSVVSPEPTVLSEVKQSDHAQIGGSRQPAFAPVAYEEQPDISKVKQMLRSSGKERPPGL